MGQQGACLEGTHPGVIPDIPQGLLSTVMSTVRSGPKTKTKVANPSLVGPTGTCNDGLPQSSNPHHHPFWALSVSPITPSCPPMTWFPTICSTLPPPSSHLLKVPP